MSLLVARAAITKNHRLGSITTETYFFVVMEPRSLNSWCLLVWFSSMIINGTAAVHIFHIFLFYLFHQIPQEHGS